MSRHIAILPLLLAACAGPRPPTAPGPDAPPAGTTTATAATDAPPVTRTPTVAEAPAAPPAIVVSAEDRARAALLLEQGRTLQREKGEGGAAEAVEIYRAAAEADPTLAAAFWEMGWSFQLLSRWDDVLAAWDRVRALDPAYPELAKAYALAKLRRDETVALAALPDPGSLPLPDETPAPGPTVRINAVGDVQLGRAWPAERAQLPPDDAADLLMHVTEALSAPDITFGNLETALADEGDSSKCGPRSTKCFAFRVPTSYARALATAGFDVMSIANNHSGDFGIEGRASTMAALDAVGIKHAGVIGDIAHLEHQGLKIALVGFSTGGGVYAVQDIETARRLVAAVDRDHDLVIVSFHGGAEGTSAAHVPKAKETFYGENRGDVYKFSRALVDAGADLVLGHGPHLLRAMEIYRGRLIAYSLGNFCTWETFSLAFPLNISTVLGVTMAANGVVTAIDAVPVIIEKPGRPRIDPEKRAIGILRQLSTEDMGAPVIDEDGKYRRP